eukprot:11194476-Lingulodinium_polyedra.AAC.1
MSSPCYARKRNVLALRSFATRFHANYATTFTTIGAIRGVIHGACVGAIGGAMRGDRLLATCNTRGAVH